MLDPGGLAHRECHPAPALAAVERRWPGDRATGGASSERADPFDLATNEPTYGA